MNARAHHRRVLLYKITGPGSLTGPGSQRSIGLLELREAEDKSDVRQSDEFLAEVLRAAARLGIHFSIQEMS